MPVPYLIALIFLTLTAALTLLLTVVMDNKNELHQKTTFRNASPLLADARSAFDITMPYSRLPDESNRIAGDTNKSPYQENPLTLPKSIMDLQSGTRQQKQFSTTANRNDIAAGSSDDSHSPHNPTIYGSHPLKGALSPNEVSSALDKIVLAHYNKISFIRDSISQQTFGQQELESMVLQHISLMEEQIAELTLRVNLEEEAQRVGTAFERVLNKRQGSFERILNRKLNILQRAS